MNLSPSTLAALILGLTCIVEAQEEGVVRNVTTIDRPRAEVYAAFTTLEGLRSVWGRVTHIDLFPGGEWVLEPRPSRHGERLVHPILAFEPGRMTSEATVSSHVVTIPADQLWKVIRFDGPDRGPTTVTCTLVLCPELVPIRDRLAEDFGDIHSREKQMLEDTKGSWLSADQPETSGTMTVEIDVPVSAERAWSFMTTPADMKKWMAPAIEIDWRVGGTIKTNYKAENGIGGKGTITHHILTYEPGVMFATRYEAPDGPPDARLGEKLFHVTTITPVDATHSRIRLTGVGYGTGEEWEKTRKFFEAGNNYEMKHIKELLENEAAEGRK